MRRKRRLGARAGLAIMLRQRPCAPCRDDWVSPFRRTQKGLHKGAKMQSESTLWDLLLQILGINAEPESLTGDEVGGLWVPGG
jgi:hypothetical protein